MKDRNQTGFILHPLSFGLPRNILPIIILFLLALAPRLLAPGEFVTVDEAYHWFERVEYFLEYVQQGDYASTNIVGHPGVTTMWLGASGLLAHQYFAQAGWVPPADSDPLLYRSFLRAPIAIVSSLCIGFAFPLVRRLYGGRVAWLATFLWAGEPFLIAHAKLLHLDSLLTSFVCLSLLAALVASHRDSYPAKGFNLRKGAKAQRLDKEPDCFDASPGSGMHISGSLVLSALAGGLAFLTKSPAFILVPMVGIILLMPVLHAYWYRKDLRHVLWQSAVRLFVWGVLATLVWAACWPAVWVDVPGVFHSIFSQAVNDGGVPHGWGNFFLGKPVDDPGPLFYPVVLAFRLAPWTLIGCILAALLTLWSYWDGISYHVRIKSYKPQRTQRVQRPDRRLSHFVTTLLYLVSRIGAQMHRSDKGPDNLHNSASEHSTTSIVCIRDTRTASLLVPSLFVVLFLTAMSIPPKKFDRYALPVFPMLDLIAACGLVHMCDFLCNCSTSKQIVLPRVAVGGLVVLIVATLLWYHPYEISYYNPLLGGGATAAAVLPVGWGEGYEEAGAFISRQPDGCERAVATWFIPVFRFAYDCPPWLVSLDEAREPGLVQYAVLYIDQLQRNNEPAATAMIQQNYTPIHTVRIHGIPYAFVYKLPLPNEYTVQADFGDAMRLIGYDIGMDAVQASGMLTLTLQWEPRAPMATDYNLFVHVLDADGHLISQIDVPPGGPQMPTSSWLVHGFLSWHHPVPLPADRLADARWLSIGIYNPATFARLPVQMTTPQPAVAPNDGPNTLVLLLPGKEYTTNTTN